mmetsp:Transcript_17485/g.40750  ORF Transcript_17485/g.40750 Transcript_17485/m.40750 type:complete len:233 (-) Transcript_17485:51-749(-)
MPAFCFNFATWVAVIAALALVQASVESTAPLSAGSHADAAQLDGHDVESWSAPPRRLAEVGRSRSKSRRKRRERKQRRKGTKVVRAGQHREVDAFASEDVLEKELDMINKRVEKLRERAQKAPFAEEERESMLEALDLYREEEVDRIEDSIEVGNALYGKASSRVDKHGRYEMEDKWGKRHRVPYEKVMEVRDGNMEKRKELKDRRKALQEKQKELEARIQERETAARRTEL